MKNRAYTVEYHLELKDGSTKSYTVEIDSGSMESRINSTGPLPDWTRLENGKCNQCSLADSEYCPIAARLAEPIQRFNGLLSHDTCRTTVVTPERTYVRQGDVQDALRSLFGLIMATSGCPLMKPFKYMARYHLPFSTLEETICRITSTYMMRQLLAHMEDGALKVDLKEIEAMYNTIRSLNEGMAKRLKGAAKGQGDSTVNAIVILNTYASLIPIIIDDELKKLQPLFE